MTEHLYVIGIDGGGTKTTAVLCAADGKILAESQGGPSNFQILGVERSANTIIDLIEACCHTIGCGIPQIGAVVAGLTGAGRPADQQLMTEGLIDAAARRNHPLNTLVVESDARIAIEGAFKGKPGIIIIGGTGSIVFAIDEKRRTYRAGGWGRLVCDEGSGYLIGQEAFRVVTRSLDGFKEKTKLTKLFSSKYGLGTQEAIIEALYKNNFDIASVVPAVTEAASKGDKAAKNILKQAASGLVNTVHVLISKMGKDRKRSKTYPLALTGALLSNKNIYSQMVRSRIEKNIPAISICEPESSAVIGAAWMAIKKLKY